MFLKCKDISFFPLSYLWVYFLICFAFRISLRFLHPNLPWDLYHHGLSEEFLKYPVHSRPYFLAPRATFRSQVPTRNRHFPLISRVSFSHPFFTYVCLPRPVSSCICFTSPSPRHVSDASATSRLRHWIS